MNVPTRSRFEQMQRIVELLANLGIVAVAVLGCAVLIRQWQPRPTAPMAAQQQMARPPAPMVGAGLTLPGVDFASADRTLVMVLSTQCHFCSESGPFYQRLTAQAKRKGRTVVVAVLPQTVDESARYLTGLGVTGAKVLQASLASVGTRGTPTLLLVDKSGKVRNTWMGRLPSARESEVLAALDGGTAGGHE